MSVKLHFFLMFLPSMDELMCNVWSFRGANLSALCSQLKINQSINQSISSNAASKPHVSFEINKRMKTQMEAVWQISKTRCLTLLLQTYSELCGMSMKYTIRLWRREKSNVNWLQEKKPEDAVLSLEYCTLSSFFLQCCTLYCSTFRLKTQNQITKHIQMYNYR